MKKFTESQEVILSQLKKSKISLIYKNESDFYSPSSSNVFSSKIGGQFYWEKEKSLPLDKDKKFMFMVCQINMAEIPECKLKEDLNISTGIVQFFLPCENTFGMGFEKGDFINSRGDYEVVFHANINQDTAALMNTNDFQDYTDSLVDNFDEHGNLPLDPHVSYELSLVHEEENFSMDDNYIKNFIPIDNILENFPEDIRQELWDLKEDKHHMFGYAKFTQDDPREFNGISEPQQEYIVLLGLDSIGEMMWGDCGIANWFIKREDLINKNINKQSVKYSWDCC